MSESYSMTSRDERACRKDRLSSLTGKQRHVLRLPSEQGTKGSKDNSVTKSAWLSTQLVRRRSGVKIVLLSLQSFASRFQGIIMYTVQYRPTYMKTPEAFCISLPNGSRRHSKVGHSIQRPPIPAKTAWHDALLKEAEPRPCRVDHFERVAFLQTVNNFARIKQ